MYLQQLAVALYKELILTVKFLKHGFPQNLVILKVQNIQSSDSMKFFN